MWNYLFCAITSWVCLIHTGGCAENCSQAVWAKRETLYVPAGGSQSLSCEVCHCGDAWTGQWMMANTTVEKAPGNAVKESRRHHSTKEAISADSTRFILDFLSVDQSDEGSYGCKVTWSNGEIEQGHLSYVNVTGAVPSQRSVLHRVLVCGAASLCLPIVLGLARCLSSDVESQPHPRKQQSTHAAVHREEPHPAPQPPPRCPIPQKQAPVPKKRSKAPPKSEQKTEVVYADISQDALRKQGASRQPEQSTVYSALSFQPAGKAEKS